MTLGLFAVAGIVTYRLEGHAVADFRALFQKMPWTMAALVVTALSIIGVPPTCGFFSKWFLIQGAMAGGCWAYVAALLFSSLVNVILFFRIFEIGYVFNIGTGDGHAPVGVDVVREAPLSMLIPTLVTALLILLVGLYNQTIVTRLIDLAVPKLY
jgi:multicomponent Na+:H+ antiporter subunit D